MNNRTFSSTYPTIARLLAVICLLLTIGALFRMDIRSFSDLPVPEYEIRIAAPGLNPLQVDQNVTMPVEAAVRSLGQADKIRSESRQGVAVVVVEASERLGTDYRERLEEKLSEAAKTLPVREWSVNQEDLADNRIGHLLLRGADVQTLADVAEYTVYAKLINLPGVARVDLDDQVARQQVDILFRPSMLQAYGLTPADVLNQLSGDVSADQVGSIGRGTERTTVQWYSQTDGPFGLGKQMIATQKGYVSLKTLAEIRDLRGSKGDQVAVYRGEPALGITLYAADSAQAPAVRAQMLQAIAELNEAGAGLYQIDLVEDYAKPLVDTIWQMTWLVILAAAFVAVVLGWMQKSKTAAILLFASVVLATGTLLGGMWLVGLPLSLSTIGPVCLFGILSIGAGSALFSRLHQLRQWTTFHCLQAAWHLQKTMLLTIVILTACWFGVMLTDFIEAKDRTVLVDAWPILILGTLSLLIVYGFIVPVLGGAWKTERHREQTVLPEEQPAAKKRPNPVLRGWETLVKRGYLPYGITLVISLLVSFLFHTFVLIDPYTKTTTDEKKLTLEMVQGSTVDEAIRAAQIAEERLRGVAEVRDVFTLASRDRLDFTLKLQDHIDWNRSLTELEKELDRQLRGIPGTDPFSFIVNDRVRSRLEFTVKGPSIQIGETIANAILEQMKRVTTRDEKGREVITDERIGEKTTGIYLDLYPKADMLTRYRVTEAEIRRQVESYLGEQKIGNAQWNGKEVSIQARFPDQWMDHPDQVKNLLIRTPEGAVRLADLAVWSYGQPPPVYSREDGLYVFKISSAVSDVMRIDTMSYALPYRLKKDMTIPEGYTILNADEVKKLDKEMAGKKDTVGRILAIGSLAVCVLLASLLLKRRTRDGWVALALLPLLSGGVILGLLIMDRPMNILGFYGLAAAAATMLQQALVHLDQLIAHRTRSTEIWEELQTGTSRVFISQAAVFAGIILASLPLAGGWVADGGFISSFTSSLLFGAAVAVLGVLVLVPGMQFAAERKQAVVSEWTLPDIIRLLQGAWENGRIRRQDKKEAIQRLKKARKEALQEQGNTHPRTRVNRELSEEDFLPLASSSHPEKFQA